MHTSNEAGGTPTLKVDEESGARPPATPEQAAEAPTGLEAQSRRPGPILRHLLCAHRVVKEIVPWSILVAAAALLLSLVAFWSNYVGRVEERRIQAWHVLSMTAPGNSGKREALEYLNKEVDVLWLITLKPRAELVGVRLGAYYGEDESGISRGGVYLRGVQLPSANLRGGELDGADLADAILNEADLSGADLRDAIMDNADLEGAVMRATDLTGAYGLTQEQLDEACGDERTKLPGGLTIRRCE